MKPSRPILKRNTRRTRNIKLGLYNNIRLINRLD